MDIENKPEQEFQFLTDEEIFINIWTSPREVFNNINTRQYDKYLYMLLFFAGVSRAFDRASMRDLGDQLPLLAIILVSIIFGGLLGWISYYIYAALLSWTGKWLQGKGNTSSILRLISYAMIPSIIALIFLIPQLSIYGIEVFKSDGDIISGDLVSNIIFYGCLIVEIILGIWTVFLLVIAISEVQEFSISKSILNILLPIIIFGIPIMLIIFIFQIF